MKVGFIGDIVGKPGRLMIKRHLKRLQQEHFIDFTIANYENASHGFGLTQKNCEELLGYGIDMMTGGNHSFDKKEIFNLFEDYPLIRPANYPKETPGEGLFRTTLLGNEIAVINLMGHYTMPMVDNPFTMIRSIVAKLKEDGIRHIIIDMHAEASSEKQALLHMLKEDVSAILGTHTHVATDDLHIAEGCCYVTDVGLTGCRDGVIGMDSEVPVKRFLTGLGGHFDVPDKCKAIFQMVVFELGENGRCIDAEKIKIYDDYPKIVIKAWNEDL
ncbi:metallophosphoesterase [Sulfurovum lithotrophicum]|uniref:Metallophosphoesterase n=1 Tax=Sulfurovum lithotrophicum TaxID=206403 RepID=A0A7U4LZV6_9BACT|nr:TIGR00282 family metallophosphoesterase [Sulfurovum lithotrophicum]AKF24294.1 metallophosphoesterase [Sulfurovum lithotrophicum]